MQKVLPFFFCRDKRFVGEALDLTARYCEIAGASVNWSKCNGLWYGSCATKPCFFSEIAWNQASLMYLRVPNSRIRSSPSYWSSLANTVKRKTDAWKEIDVLILTRACVYNIFLVSKPMCVLQVLYCARINVPEIPQNICRIHMALDLQTHKEG